MTIELIALAAGLVSQRPALADRNFVKEAVRAAGRDMERHP